MRKIEIEELKKIQIQILDEVASFCDKHQIRYFLMAGTLLGAVRHQGYIPWDDDIDIGMLREDYERFLELYSKEQGDYYIYTHRLNSKSTFPFMKVCLKNTVIKEEFLGTDEEYGINIDIFPIDAISSVNANSVVQQIMSLLRQRHLKVVNLPAYWKKKDKLFFIRAICKGILSVVSYRSIFMKIDDIIQKEATAPVLYKGNILWGYGEKELVAPDIFDSFTQVTFEDKLYTAPMNYHAWLTAVYGDYMILPPEEKRVSNHTAEAFVGK